MGIHAYILEHGRCASQLLSLHDLSSKPRAIGIPLESYSSDFTLHIVPFRVLGVGYK